MSKSATPRCFLGQTDFSLLFARSVAGSSPVRLEALREVLLTDTDALAPAAQAVFGPAPAEVICALRPKPRHLHLATADEAKKHSGVGGVRQFAAAKPSFASLPPGRFAAAQARDGATPAGAPWLLDLSSASAHSATLAALEALKVRPARSVSAILQDVGALTAAVTAPTWLLEIGEHSSQALLVSRAGVIAAGEVSLNLDRIAEAVQAELGLKFRGSAVKLFFNPDYDFSEAGIRIATRIAAALKPELTALQASHDAPVALLGAGLPAGQQWFATHLATALGITAFAPDFKALGVTLEQPEPETAISPAWFGFLRMIGAEAGGTGTAWQAEWLAFDATAAATAPAPAPAAVVPATPAPKAPPAKPAVVEPVAVKQPVAAPTPVPVKAAPATPTPAPKAAAPKPDAPKAVESKPAAPKPTPAPAPVPTRVVVAPAKAAVEPKPAAEPVSRAPAPFNKKIVIVVAALALLITGGVLYYAHVQKEEAARLAEQRALIEQKLQAEVAKSRLAEQQARAEAEARKKAETESAQRLAETQAARERAETEARSQAAARLANARGGLTLSTDPAGAMITVGNLPPKPSPATFSDVRIGHYPVTVALANYETVNLDLEIKEDAITDGGTIKLQRLVGTLEIATDPGEANYEVRPAGAFIISPEARRTGRTPVALNDLPPGDYVVTLARDGWTSHSENINIARDATSRVQWTFPKGIVKIGSTPAGATVTRDGAELGVTPLTLSDQEPGAANFTLTLNGYASDTISGRIVGGQTLELTPTLERMEHVSRMNEVDQKPVLLSAVQPKLSYELRQSQRTGHVDIELTVTRTGSTTDAVVKPGSDRELAPFCVAAALQWKFKPATIKGKAVNVRLIVPFDIGPST